MRIQNTINEDFEYLLNHRNYFKPVYINSIKIKSIEYHIFYAYHKWTHNKIQKEEKVILSVFTNKHNITNKISRFICKYPIYFDYLNKNEIEEKSIWINENIEKYAYEKYINFLKN